MRKALVVAIVLVTACKKDSKPAATGSASTAADCQKVITGAFQRAARAGMEKGATEGGNVIDDKTRGEMDAVAKDLDAQFRPVAAAITAVCVSDHWPAEMLTCVGQAKTGDEIDACNSHLDEAQQKHLDAVTEEALAKAKTAPAASPTCNKYADLEIKCNAAGEDARATILDFCAKARAGDKGATYQLIALESTCADTAGDCDSYKACVEKKKSETSPTP